MSAVAANPLTRAPAAATSRADRVRSRTPPARRPGLGALLLIASLLGVGVGLLLVPDGGDGAEPRTTAAPETQDAPGTDAPGTDAPGPGDDVDVGPELGGALTETVGGLACRGPDGPTTCVTHLAELDLADGDDVRVVRGRIVVAGEDGTVRAHSLRDGSMRWQTSFEAPITLHPELADSLPIATADALHVVDLDSGNRVGRIDVEAHQVAAVGPWIVVDDGERIGAFGVTGRPGWTRELDGATALLSSSGTYVQSPGSLEALFGNTGEVRFDAPVSGSVGAVTQQDGRVMLATDQPPAIRNIAPDGTVRSRTPLAGEQLLWADFTPDGQRLVALTGDGDDNLQWLTIVDRFRSEPPRQIPLSGRRTALDPVLDDRVLLLPYRGFVDLLVVDLVGRAVINRVSVDRPLTDLALAEDGGFATIDDLGTLRVQGLSDGAPAYSVALGPRAQLLQARPLLVRTERAVVAFDDVTRRSN